MSILQVPISINSSAKNKVNAKDMATLNKGFSSEILHIDDIVNHILEGHAISPAWMEVDDEGHSIRKNSAFKQAQLIFLDIDNSIKVEDVKRRKTDAEGYLPWERVVNNESIRENAFLIYTTPSHTTEWNRFRIVFCLPEPITDVGRYREIVKAFVDRVSADEACKAPVNIFYGNTDAEIHPYGNQLDQKFVDQIVQYTTHIKREERLATNHINGNLTEDHIREMLVHLPPKLDYADWIRVISGVASRFDEDTTVRLIEDWSPGKPGEVRYKVRHRLEQVGIGTVIYLAKQHGYTPRGIYKDTKLEEDAGLIFPGVKYRLTQYGNAERFVDAHRDTVRYCVERKQWYVWDGKRLAPDAGGNITKLAMKTFRDIVKEAADVPDAKQADATLKWAKTSESKVTIDASLDLAHRGTDLTILADQLDSKPYHINLNNGIFDLETLTLGEHDIEELHTKIIPIDWDDQAECPAWEAFLVKIFDGDLDLIRFIQKAVGYSLTAVTTEECLFFAYGSGANGKSIFFSVLDMLLGGAEGYSFKAKNELVMMRKGDPGVPMDIAELKGMRLVYTDELPENRRFDENKIKDITSHDRLNGRFLYERSFTFLPSHKLWMYGNHRPPITGQDDGIWRRIHLIPFTVKIPKDQQRPPEELKAEFRVEAPGILRWAIDGFHAWKYGGRLLPIPARIQEANAAYRSEMDTIGSFIAEEIVETPGAVLRHKDLYTRYKAWCMEQGISHIMTSKKLSRHLLETKGWASQIDRKESREWKGYQFTIHEQGSIF